MLLSSIKMIVMGETIATEDTYELGTKVQISEPGADRNADLEEIQNWAEDLYNSISTLVEEYVDQGLIDEEYALEPLEADFKLMRNSQVGDIDIKAKSFSDAIRYEERGYDWINFTLEAESDGRSDLEGEPISLSIEYPHKRTSKNDKIAVGVETPKFGEIPDNDSLMQLTEDIQESLEEIDRHILEKEEETVICS